MNLIEDDIWDEVESVLRGYKDNTIGLLLERFDNAEVDREKQIVKAKDEIGRCNLEKQRLINQVRKGRLTDDDIELSLRAIREDQEYWQQELTNLEVLNSNADAAWNSFWNQLKALEKYDFFGFDFNTSPEQKKEILNLLLEEFILYNDGKVELRFKLPVNEKQVSETILTLSGGVKSSHE